MLGAGVVGVTTAHKFAEAGHDVIVFDKGSAVASETSHANGGQLSFSFTDPLATPNMLLKLPKLFLNKDPSFNVKHPVSWGFLKWGLQFVQNCNRSKMHENTCNITSLSTKSFNEFNLLREKFKVKNNNGKLLVTKSKTTFEAAKNRLAIKQEKGVQIEDVTFSECMDIEPAITGWSQPIVGGFYACNDVTLCAKTFANEMFLRCSSELGVTFKLGSSITNLVFEQKRVVGVEADGKIYKADAVIVALGPFSDQFLRPYGVKLPLYPVKGYSFTAPATKSALKTSVTDLDHKTVYAPLNGAIRIAGLADFAGYDFSVVKTRLDWLKKTSELVFPTIANYDQAHNDWCGLRPTTPDSYPVLGKSSIKGLYLNCGHGALGWTLSFGSAAVLLSEVERVELIEKSHQIYTSTNLERQNV